MADRPLHDYSRSRAVLMGTWDYSFLEPVPAAENSLQRMAGLLSGPLCGWPRDRLVPLENESGPGDLPDRLITAFDGIRDVALFYFVGHGQLAPDDQLCLGLGLSRPEANRRAATSLRFSDVRQALNECPAATKIVILDCCFAGLATSSALAGLAGDVLDLTGGTGAYTMAATSAYATAWYEDSPRVARPQTYFTKYLADLVEKGLPGQPSRLRLEALYRQLHENLATDQRPIPSRRAVDDAREFVFAYNAAPPRTHYDPEQELARVRKELEGLRAETDSQVRALQSRARELERELARLRDLAASSGPHGGTQERQLQDAIDETARELADTQTARAEAMAAASGPPGTTADDGVTLTGPLLQHPWSGEPPDEVRTDGEVLAEWALWGMAGETAYQVLRCSDGVFSRENFHDVIIRFASGVMDELPQYTVCWIPGSDDRDRFLAVSIHELADPDPARSGGRSRVIRGREVEYVRLFCVRYSEMADLAVSYPELVRSVMEYQLPAGGTAPIRITLRGESDPGRVAAKFRDLAVNVAALLLTTRKVCVLGAERTTAEDRLRFIELVMSMLPYGLRTTMSASTWASSTAQDLKLRLFFTNAPRDDGGRTSRVTWGEPEQLDFSGPEYEDARLYLRWLRRTDANAAPALAERTEPLRFSHEDVRRLVAHLLRDHSVIETLEDLADSLRNQDRAAVATGVERLSRHLASRDDRSEAADREACRQAILSHGMLKDRPALRHDIKARLYEVLLKLAFDTPLTYASYCEIERSVGDPPRGTLRSVLLEFKFSSFIPLLLTARAEPSWEQQQLVALLAHNGIAPTVPIDEVAQHAKSIWPEHRAAVYDFAASYLRGAQDPWSELKERGCLAETLKELFPGDLGAQRARLTDTLTFLYGGPLSAGQISDLFNDSRLHPTVALEQAVRGMAASPQAGEEIARQAASARISSAGYEADALLPPPGRPVRFRRTRLILRRYHSPMTVVVVMTVTVLAIAGVEIYFLVSIWGH